MHRLGLERRPDDAETQGIPHISPTPDTNLVVVGGVSLRSYGLANDLGTLITAWGSLPDAIKAGILAMVRAAGTPTASRDANRCPTGTESPNRVTQGV